MKKRIIFWVIVAVILIIGIATYLKYAPFGATVVTVLVGLGGIVLGWIARMLYCKYIKE